jgi:hypothetical protein
MIVRSSKIVNNPERYWNWIFGLWREGLDSHIDAISRVTAMSI